MHELEAKFKILTGLVESKHVEAAELLVRKAIELSATSAQPLDVVLNAMLVTAYAFKHEEDRPTAVTLNARRQEP